MKQVFDFIIIFYCTDICPVSCYDPVELSLNFTFGKGTANPGPLSVGHTDFTYTTNPTPAAGSYSIINSGNDAGHVFFGPTPMKDPSGGYKMLVCYDGLFTSKIVFSDTLRNLCGNNKYLFWSEINNVNPGSCLLPELTFSVETTSGVVITHSRQVRLADRWLRIIIQLITVTITKYLPCLSLPFYGWIFNCPSVSAISS